MNDHNHSLHDTHPHHVQHHAGRGGNSDNDTFRLAVSATFHCLLGCGIGEVVGMVISTHLGLGNIQSIALSVVLGFIAGLALGIVPLLKRSMAPSKAVHAVIVGEGLSIAVMEVFEVMTQIAIPGVMDAHLSSSVFWIGMVAALAVGFVAALPINVIMIRKGIRHQH